MGSQPGQSQAGFSLLEVMISVVVLSIGLLGLAAMQEIASSRNIGANDLTVATNLATEMIERVQYSKKQVSFYNGIDVSSSTNNCPSGGTVPLMVTGALTVHSSTSPAPPALPRHSTRLAAETSWIFA